MSEHKPPAALVIGAGIAGIQAALDIANAGFQVYLVEREPSVGGHMSQLDKTFPTLDCSACILTPKMVDVAGHPRITLMTYSELLGIEGQVGAFRATVRKKARYVDVTKCTGCGDCAKVCPVTVPSEFNLGMADRHAIYIPFPQAVPNKYTIDKRGWPPCKDACPAHIDVQGYVALIGQGKHAEALALIRRTIPFPGVIGRVCNHPCETACNRARYDQPIAICTLKRFAADFELQPPPPDSLDSHPVPRTTQPEPRTTDHRTGAACCAPTRTTQYALHSRDQRVAIVGSGPAGLTAAHDLALEGYAATVFEALPVAGGMLAVGIPDYRLPPEVLAAEVAAIAALGVDIRLNTPIGGPAGPSLEELRRDYDAVLVAVGAHQERQLRIEGEELSGVLPGAVFLRDLNLARLSAAGEQGVFPPPSAAAPVGSAPPSDAPSERSAPLSAAPIGPAPLSAVPDGSAPLSAAPVGSAPLSAVPVGSAPLSAAPAGSTPSSAAPVGSAPLSAAPVGSAPLSAVPDGSVPLSAVPDGSVPLSAVPVGAALCGRPLNAGNVAVVGGGNVAIDAARAALRLGAASVTIVYRRSRTEMPASAWEVEDAEQEGIRFHFLANPVRILGHDGRVAGLECIRMELGEPDASGRRRPVPVPGSEFVLEVDTVIPAIGQAPDLAFVPAGELPVTRWDTLAADPETLATGVPGLFAAGDAVSGPATAIQAIADGKRAALSIHRYLQGEELPRAADGRTVVPFEELDLSRARKRPRADMHKLAPQDRTAGFAEVELGLTEEQAVAEAQRCLNCAVCSECRECEIACQPHAIVHDMRDELLDLEVGAIVVATGFDPFDAAREPEFGYGRYPNVITGLQFERLASASGPTAGKIKLNGHEPKEIVFIHCVGSRHKQVEVEYCSRVCCMYTAKQAHLAHDKVPGAHITVFYMDVRAFGKGFEEFYDRVRAEGINYRRGNPAEIFQRGDKLVVRAEDTLLGKTVEVPADLVVLAAGVRPRADAGRVADMLGLELGEDGFFAELHPELRPVDTRRPGVFVAGNCQAPKDIPDTVAQAKAAASGAIVELSRLRRAQAAVGKVAG